jgi:sodium/proline symporter
MGYLIGMHAMWIVIGEVLGVTLAWTLVALPFKEYTDRYDSITVPDYLESRFQDRRHLLRIASFVIIFSMVTAYTAAQLTASGKAFASFLGTSYTAGALIGAAVILYYTSVGGFKAVAYTDLLQGLLMFGGLLVLPVVGIASVGGWSELTSRLQSIDPNLLRPLGALGFSVRGCASALSFIGIGFAFLGAPQLLTRFMAARDRDQIVEARWIAIVCIIVFDTGAVLGGMAGRALFPGLTDSENILPTMSLALFPVLFAGLYLVVVLAAIMSTVDSLLILASSAVVRDVIQQILHPRISEERLSLYGRLTTVVIGGAALVFALGEVRMIFWFVLFAWSALGSAFTPVVLCSLFWKRTTRAGALAGMLAGFLTAILWVLFFKESFFDLYEMVPGFLAGFLVTIGVSLLSAPPESAETEYDAVWQALRTPSAGSRAVPATDEAD